MARNVHRARPLTVTRSGRKLALLWFGLYVVALCWCSVLPLTVFYVISVAVFAVPLLVVPVWLTWAAKRLVSETVRYCSSAASNVPLAR
jgi:hypothetical protein